jgi:hypothetical protein
VPATGRLSYERVTLRHTLGGRAARVRELTGHDEAGVDGLETAAAIRLLDRLLVPGDEAAMQPGQAADLTAADRDRLLAAVYRRAYGDHVESTVTCRACGRPFDLSFSLAELGARVLDGPAEGEAQADGTVRLAGGLTVRLPTGHDELRVTALPAAEAAEALYRSCLVETETAVPADALGEALERIAPVFDVELHARCVECGSGETLRFDIQSFLLGALRQERRRLLGEVHRIALAYRWSLDAILSLTRGDRRQYVELIEAEPPRLRRGAA